MPSFLSLSRRLVLLIAASSLAACSGNPVPRATPSTQAPSVEVPGEREVIIDYLLVRLLISEAPPPLRVCRATSNLAEVLNDGLLTWLKERDLISEALLSCTPDRPALVIEEVTLSGPEPRLVARYYSPRAFCSYVREIARLQPGTGQSGLERRRPLTTALEATILASSTSPECWQLLPTTRSGGAGNDSIPP